MNKASESFLSPSSNQKEHKQHSAAITDNYSPPRVYGPSQFVRMNVFLISHCHCGPVFSPPRKPTNRSNTFNISGINFFSMDLQTDAKERVNYFYGCIWNLVVVIAADRKKNLLWTRWIIVPWRVQAASVTTGHQFQKFPKERNTLPTWVKVPNICHCSARTHIFTFQTETNIAELLEKAPLS